MSITCRRDEWSVPRLLAALVAVLASVGSAGCGGGGGGGGSSSTPPTTGTPTPSIATATFHVDVASGQVTVTPNNAVSSDGALKSHVVFSGSAVSFNSSVLSDQAGNTGVKVVNVSLTSHFDLPIGQTSSGQATPLLVLFSPFTNVNAASDLRPRTTVSTVAGTGTAGSTDSSAAASTFSSPYGVACEGQTTYVADYGNNRIRKIASGNVSTLAGSGTAASVDGFGSAASFNGPTSVAVNPVDSSLIVTEYTANRIRRVSTTGSVTTVAGTGSAGGTNGLGTVATFAGPVAATVDANGAIYVVEATGDRVRRIILTGSNPNAAASYTVSTLAGSGSAGSADGVGTAATFSAPRAITFDGSTGLYLADRGNNKIRRVDLSGAVTTVAGTGVASSVDGAGNVATFNGPTGIVYLNGALIVSEDTGARFRQVTLTDGASVGQSSSWKVHVLAGTGTVGSANGAGNVATFNKSQFIAADIAGNIVLADFGSNKIRKITPTAGFFPIGTPPGSGSPSTIPVQLSNADGTVPSSGFGSNSPYITYPGGLYSGESTSGKPWWFVVPSGVTAFEFTVSVEALTPGLEPPTSASGGGSPTAIVRTLAGVTNSTGFNDGTGTEARMGLVKYDDIDIYGNVYFTDLSNSALRRITPAGLVTTIAGGLGNIATAADGSGATAKISSINAVATTPDGLNVFFGDGSMVRVATIPSYLDATDAGNWTITTLGGSATVGNTDGVLTGASFNVLEDFAWDNNAKVLYASEFFGNRIRKITYKGGGYGSGANWQVSTLAGDTAAVSGASGNTDGIGTSALFNNPRGIDVDRLGNVWVADQSNFAIRKITPLQVVTTVAGSGVQGYGDGAGTAAAVKFNLAYGITVDSSGYVYVGDIGNFDVRRIDPAGNVTTVAGIVGSPGGVDGTGNVATFVRPAGLAVAPDGDLMVCDQSSMRMIQRLVTTGTQ